MFTPRIDKSLVRRRWLEREFCFWMDHLIGSLSSKTNVVRHAVAVLAQRLDDRHPAQLDLWRAECSLSLMCFPMFYTCFQFFRGGKEGRRPV